MFEELSQPSSAGFAGTGSSQIPIAELSSDTPQSAERSIQAVVTLIWPYSASSNTLTVLLAEPDFRLRRKRGQIRVQFTGPSAHAVARAHLVSGNEVELSLQGVQWVQKEQTVRTPGNTVDCEALFRDRLLLRVRSSAIPEALAEVS